MLGSAPSKELFPMLCLMTNYEMLVLDPLLATPLLLFSFFSLFATDSIITKLLLWVEIASGAGSAAATYEDPGD